MDIEITELAMIENEENTAQPNVIPGVGLGCAGWGALCVGGGAACIGGGVLCGILC